MITNQKVGFVVIGRNEGKRLHACLHAIKRYCNGSPVIYVDSGSTDDSVSFAKSMNYEVLELDLSIPFTAARARNSGYLKLVESYPKIEFIQFLDGDCELQPNWIEPAIDALENSEKIAIVSGRRVEKNKNTNIFNKLMDIEWDTPIGETKAVPGDMCVKKSVLTEVNGFTENIISAEDDEFCIRVRQSGYKVCRLDVVMTHHDANITSLSQWYKRSKRAGHGYANINHLHGRAPDYYFRRNLIGVLFWGGIFPLLFLTSLFVNSYYSLFFLTFYLIFILKSILTKILSGHSCVIAVVYTLLIYTSKVPELLGVFKYWKTYITSGQHQLIEYK